MGRPRKYQTQDFPLMINGWKVLGQSKNTSNSTSPLYSAICPKCGKQFERPLYSLQNTNMCINCWRKVSGKSSKPTKRGMHYNLYLEEELFREFKDLCSEEQVSMKSVIANGIQEWIDSINNPIPDYQSELEALLKSSLFQEFVGIVKSKGKHPDRILFTAITRYIEKHKHSQ